MMLIALHWKIPVFYTCVDKFLPYAATEVNMIPTEATIRRKNYRPVVAFFKAGIFSEGFNIERVNRNFEIVNYTRAVEFLEHTSGDRPARSLMTRFWFLTDAHVCFSFESAES